MLKKGLQALLKNDATIAAAVGPRVRIGRIPEGTSYPVIVLHVISPEYFISLQGVNATQAKIVQINCWAKTPKGADELAQAVHNLLDGFRGTLSEGSGVMACIPSGEVDSEDEQLKLSCVAVDFKMYFTPGELLDVSPP
jgi:hypothetical protein